MRSQLTKWTIKPAPVPIFILIWWKLHHEIFSNNKVTSLKSIFRFNSIRLKELFLNFEDKKNWILFVHLI